MRIPFAEIRIYIITKRKQVVMDIRKYGNSRAINLYMFRYSRGLREAYDYITKVEEELHHVKGNQVQATATSELHESPKSDV